MTFFPNCAYVNTSKWMHHMDTSETHREKAGLELNKILYHAFLHDL